MSEQGSYHIPEFTAADRFRKARTDAKLTQEELADRIDVDKKTIGNYETGATTHLRKSVVNQWALATRVPVEWLRDGTTPESDPDNHPRSGSLDGPTDLRSDQSSCTSHNADLLTFPVAVPIVTPEAA